MKLDCEAAEADHNDVVASMNSIILTSGPWEDGYMGLGGVAVVSPKLGHTGEVLGCQEYVARKPQLRASVFRSTPCVEI